uniref:Uncharacterized protein n=1 Tax=Fagus sylvatica TaxID=28930 RepID=A0A2N9IHA5_FAGSY
MGLGGEGELGEYREFEINEDREVPLVLVIAPNSIAADMLP